MKLNRFYMSPEGDAPPAGDVPPAPPAGDTPPPAPPAGDVPPPAPPAFYQTLPDDWRKQSVAALGLEEADLNKRLGQLERISDYPTLVKSYFEAQDKIRQGAVSTGLPKDPTPEQLSAYREANGIPPAPDAYKVEHEAMSDTDRAILNPVLGVAHKYNIPQSAMQEMMDAQMSARQAKLDELIARDGVESQQTTEQMKQLWGQDSSRNMNIVNNLVNQLPEAVRDVFKDARLANGKLMFNSPEVLHFLADLGRKAHPTATVVDPNSANPVGDLTAEIKAIEAKMGTEEYFKDASMQQRYRELVDARGRLSK